MAVKKSQIEDKSIKPDKEKEDVSGNRESKKEKEKEFNYPEHNITVKAKSKKEADKKLKELIN
jgi:type IV secretory pathway VirB4 component